MFKPLNIKEQKLQDTPLFELNNFETKELNEKGLSAITKGSRGIRYNDRYKVIDLDYIDNTGQYLAEIKSNTAVYKDDLINLNGDVVYTRENGFVFKTQKASYNTKTKIAISKTRYTSQMGQDRATGSYLEYNNDTGTIKSKNIVANYKLKER